MTIPCLSIWQPWASVIFEIDANGRRVKTDETRSWSTHIRGRIAIHASKTMEGVKDFDQDDFPPRLRMGNMPFGAIIGTAWLKECWRTEEIVGHRSKLQLSWGDYSRGRYAFELVNTTLLPQPIPYRGQQGFFNVELP
jgi:hypothetical protein